MASRSEREAVERYVKEYRKTVRRNVKALQKIPTLGTAADMVTQGRVSGMHLALSLLPPLPKEADDDGD